eukprot:CAMPEP_0171182294 /NCGR_PEP_ID=MMETSP0790-20130122/14694_1 /TAXON_ID=2925 /ORGANISM="Alexandrium catenella, Strain OF101" /LENGTH=117 /DNA_ID=CAMNT_0011647245 /DNA_START=1 /DNA_END=354 /DNA_ORIENTATION=+
MNLTGCTCALLQGSVRRPRVGTTNPLLPQCCYIHCRSRSRAQLGGNATACLSLSDSSLSKPRRPSVAKKQLEVLLLPRPEPQERMVRAAALVRVHPVKATPPIRRQETTRGASPSKP